MIIERPIGAVSSSLASLHPVIARIYAGRGVSELSELEKGLETLLPDGAMLGIDAGVARLVTALRQQESILIVGDFDCDGATSTTTALLALRAFGFNQVDYLVPNRFEYGYGLSPEIVEVAQQKQPDLIITVDNGISSIEGVDRANMLGIDVIVTDHHLPGSVLPKAVAIINPNQAGCQFMAKSTCGAGVIFYLLIALRRQLQQLGWFEKSGVKAPNLANYLDLIALGTVADVVPLERNNRTLVHQGLARIRAGRARPGLLALLEVAGRDNQRISSSDLGFAVAPRLNAAGRLDDISLGIECLLEEDPQRAREYAEQLDALNRERRSIESEMQAQAMAHLESLDLLEAERPAGIALFNEQWHQGVIGILASRVKEKLHRPVIVFAPGDEGEIKGSARSIEGFHIRDGLDRIATEHPGLISKFGGHAMAAGLTISKADLARFETAFAAEVTRQTRKEDLDRVIETDGELAPNQFTMELAQMIQEAGPWGHQFPEPSFHGEFRLLQQRIVGQKHLKMVLQEPTTGLALDAIAFNVESDIWPNASINRVRAVYRLDINEFRGQRSLQLMVEWLKPL
ncbi:Single-stranded-DNA-specific exonuclease RecJ [Marinobacterium sp. xm-a-127]|jgi:single-stranded-DNA-specific exonuclease|nr:MULTISPECIES: single-stranded-DNA-specific exonuclease RecJ [unclassified Marinobacterium]NRP09145.1 Single-stranded-DNA-specific exonuclease RecJ [Marinobacterium sp. xm-g-48]NRP47508.1 Single-stranded-DNA-specific exonuclease RecJ [Marinobacterium sp. xm-d-543]NRP56703.1 Single-stranded-DNA-specific exonuclease RecJ [Marinobacterium sp. xm-d-510]NRP60290.1 Single-stranded-DNA-specific exonuclease RecJ [Marinobacterium sp. xm-d-564]NRP82324.1 Single-stranded-DNA-specific exonuclease RecJ [